MSILQMAVPFENRTQFSNGFCPNGQPFCRNHLKTEPFANRTAFNHLKTGLVRYSGGNCTCIALSLKHVITGLVVNVHRWLATPTHSKAQTVATLPTATAAATRPTIATPRTDPLSCLTTYKRTMTRRYQTTLSSTISRLTNRH